MKKMFKIIEALIIINVKIEWKFFTKYEPTKGLLWHKLQIVLIKIKMKDDNIQYIGCCCVWGCTVTAHLVYSC